MQYELYNRGYDLTQFVRLFAVCLSFPLMVSSIGSLYKPYTQWVIKWNNQGDIYSEIKNLIKSSIN